MPELPDVTIYVEALVPRVVGARLAGVRVHSPFVLRTFDPPLDSLIGRDVTGVERLGKRIVLAFRDELFVVMHLMIAGRLRWESAGARPPAKITLAALVFEPDTAGAAGTLFLTESSKQKRAALHVCRGREALRAHDPGGVEPLTATADAFRAALLRENRTLKRALTDPRIFSGIGNAYSDEILHAARLSPVQTTQRLDEAEILRLHAATRETLARWTEELQRLFAGRFPGPGEITAFRPGFAVHGRFGKPCPACGTAVQRIRYAENETNYCPRCQTGGRLLADRSLSRLLKDDWPRTIEELEY